MNEDKPKVTRSEFDAMSNAEKNEFIKQPGAYVVPDMTAREYRKLDSREKAQFEREGGVITRDRNYE